MTFPGQGGFAGWQNLPPDAFNESIAPGWTGPGSGTATTFQQWKTKVEDWRAICKYETPDSQLKALKLRMPQTVQDMINNFPPRYMNY